MANSRKAGKKNVNVWLNEDEQELVNALMDATGLNRTEVIKEAISLLSKEQGQKKKGIEK